MTEQDNVISDEASMTSVPIETDTENIKPTEAATDELQSQNEVNEAPQVTDEQLNAKIQTSENEPSEQHQIDQQMSDGPQAADSNSNPNSDSELESVPINEPSSETQQQQQTTNEDHDEQEEEDITPSIQISEAVPHTEQPLPSSPSHKRTESILSTNTIASNTKSTLLLAKNTFETILQEKEIKKYPNAQKIIESTMSRVEQTMGQSGSFTLDSIDSILIFEALRASCRTKSSHIKRKALDCLSKLFSFRALDESLLINPPDSMASNDQNQNTQDGITPPPKQLLIDAAIDTIADCFDGEGTNEKLELQIVRALSSCILAEDATSLCHGQSLLKAIRTIYNIFVFSLNPSNQGIAQATLTQVISYVFERVDVKKLEANAALQSQRQSASNIDVTGGSPTEDTAPLTLENINRINADMETTLDDQEDQDIEQNNPQALAIKDTFLVFRTMAKICAKPLEADLDMRSHAVRSKLLSLHIIYSIIKEHIDLFLSPVVYLPGKDGVTLLESIRQYLCLSLSRNAASPVSPVFEITLEIMWLLISNLRAEFKREIPVFLNDIYFPIAELKASFDSSTKEILPKYYTKNL